MIYTNKTQAKKLTSLSYLGGVATSSKIEKNLKMNEMTYVLYLAPASLSGHNVCSMSTYECRESCLNESGRNRIDIHDNTTNIARIRKTKLFFEHREFFMGWLVDEIRTAKNKAEKLGFRFSVRLNGTSDLSPEIFKLHGKCILDIFNDVQFYDYTKVFNRVKLLSKYSNYDLTFSFSGENETECLEALKNGARVAVVFNKPLPDTFWGYPVIDGDKYDMRYIDSTACIIGLKYKKVRNRIDFSKSTFVIS